MFNELKVIENIDILFKTKVILFGAGFHGKKISCVLEQAGIPTMYFCDNAPEKWGSKVGGKEIISPQKLKELDSASDLTIIITVVQHAFVMDIINVIESLNLKSTNLLTPLGLDILLAQNIGDYRIREGYRAFALYVEKLENIISSYFIKKIIVEEIVSYIKDADCNVLIYQPGKVGSRTIFDSLLAIGIKAIHTHYLADLEFDDIEIKVINEYLSAYRHMLNSRKNVKIITLVREPIDRAYSSIFQSTYNNSANTIMRLGESFADACSKCLENVALRGNSFTFSRHQFDWFDQEIKAVFGIDVFDHKFDKEKGYSIIKQGNVEMLLMKLEKLNTLEAVIGEFVGAPDFKLINSNEGNNKPYKYLYKNLKAVIKIPKEVVSLYYDNNPRMDYFYTDEEKAAFLKKWEGNIEK